MSLTSWKIRSSFQFFILNFKFFRTLPRKAIPQFNCLVLYYFSMRLCCFRFISLLHDTAGTIPATSRLASNFWIIHSTTYQVQTNFVGKGLWIYYRNGQPLFCSFIQISTEINYKQLIPFRESHIFLEVIPGVLGHSVNSNVT